MFCKFSNSFGTEGEGIHSTRVFGVAAVDLLATVLVAFACSMFFGASLWRCLFVLIALGIVAHRVCCVNTAVNVCLFGRV
jgi:hypothetical protein